MKVNVLFFLLGMFVFFSSCDDDDEPCEPGTLSENIIGTWTASYEEGDVEFLADGTLIDPNDVMIGAEINGTVLDEKTYTATDESITLTAASGELSSEATVDVTSFDCDAIEVSIFGIPATLTRK